MNGDADVIGLDGIHIEVKRVESFRLYTSLEQAIRDKKEGEMPVVFHRQNGKPWVCIMTMEDFMELYRKANNE